jgi:RNA polymerase sigma factor (sigma-70 family)
MDIVQDAAIEVLKYGPRFHVSDDGRFRALLARIIENVLRDRNDWYRAKRRAISRESPLSRDTVLDLDPPRESAERPSQAAVRNERQAWVRLVIECLPEEERRVITLRDWDGLTYAAIGERLDLSINAVRNRYLRAMDHLEKEFYAMRNGRIDAEPAS